MTARDVRLRDTGREHRILTVPRSDWAAFVAGVQGRHGLAEESITIERGLQGVVVRSGPDGESVIFDLRHWEVFLEGVRAGEFDL